LDQKQLESLVARAPKTLRLGDLEPQVLALALDHRTFFLNLHGFLKPEHFDTPVHAQVWGWLVAFFREKHLVPSRASVEHAFAQADVHFSLPTLDLRSSEYVKDEVYRIVRGQQLERFIIRLLLESQSPTPGLSELHQEFGKVVNLRDTGNTGWLDYFDVENRYAKLSSFWEGRIPSGFPTLDQLLPGGGFGRKEMVAIMGPPGSGKCTVPSTEVDVEIDLVIEIGPSDKIISGEPINATDRALSSGIEGRKKRLANDYTVALSDLRKVRQSREAMGDQGPDQPHGKVPQTRFGSACCERVSDEPLRDGEAANLSLRLRSSSKVRDDYAPTVLALRTFSQGLPELSLDQYDDSTRRVGPQRYDARRGQEQGRPTKEKDRNDTQSSTNEPLGQSKMELPVPGILDRQEHDDPRGKTENPGASDRKCEESQEPPGALWLSEPIILAVYRRQEQLYSGGGSFFDTGIRSMRIKTSTLRETTQCEDNKDDRRDKTGGGALRLCEQGVLPLAEWVEDLVRGYVRDRIYPLVRTELEDHPALRGFGDQVLRSPYVERENLFPRLPGRRIPGSRSKGESDEDSRSKSSEGRQHLWGSLSSIDPTQIGQIARILPASNTDATTPVPGTDTTDCQGHKKRIWRVTLRCRCQVGFLVGLKNVMPDLPIRVFSETGYRNVEYAWFTQPNPEWYLETENGKNLFCADDHRVQTKSGFEFVQRLRRGTEISTAKGWSKILLARPTNRTLPMVDLQVEGRHYFSEGILSHNTLWLINLAARALSNGYKVLHITREVSEDIVGLRYDCCFLQATTTELLGDRPATIDRIKKLRSGLKLSHPLFIREYPTGGATIDQCRADYLGLRERESFQADLIIDDYPDLAKPSRPRDKEYSEQGLIFIEFRGWMVEEQTAGLVGTQTTRGAEDLSGEMIQMKHSSDSYHKPRVVDAMLTINESADDKTTGHQRLFMAKNRNEKSNVWGKFKVDKAKMRVSDIFHSSHDVRQVGQ